MSNVFNLKHQNISDTRYGGKGYNLKRLFEYGFNVPCTLILTTDAYDQFIETNGLLPTIEKLYEMITIDNINSKKVIDHLGQLQNRMKNGNIPEHIYSELFNALKESSLINKPLAIRSSASLEDSDIASFAGIHHSYLNVNGIENVMVNIKKIYASLWTEKAVSYRLKMNLNKEEIKQAVVIMELIAAKSSGVAFSCDPLSGRQDTILINANFGLGESLVSGNVEPDEYRLSTKNIVPKIASISLGEKKTVTVLLQDNGIKHLNNQPDGQNKKVLEDLEIEQLGLLVQRIYDAVGEGEKHQDIEWVFNGNEFFIVQTRPVTKVPIYTYEELKGQPQIWSNANMKDAMPMVQTPLGWQYVKRLSVEILSAPLKLTDYKHLEGLEYAKLFQGRGYFNLSLLQWEFYDAIGITPKETNQSLGGHHPEIIIPPEYNGMKFKRMIRMLKLAKEMMAAQSSINLAFERVTKYTQSFLQKDLTKVNDQELVHSMEEILEETFLYIKTFSMATNSSGLSFNQLLKELEKSFPNKGNSILNKLLMGKGNITSAEHGYQLIELAEIANDDAEANEYFTSENYDPTVWKQELSIDSKFKSEFQVFIDTYGHRGTYEGEISNPRWREDPSYLLNYIKSTFGRDKVIKTKPLLADKNQKEWNEILNGVSFFRKWRIKKLARKAIQGAELREMSKSQLIRLAEPSRLIALEIGERFFERGILPSTQEVFYCTWSEIIAILRGYWNGDRLKYITMGRKQKMEAYKKEIPSDTIMNDTVQSKKDMEIESVGNYFSGLGVATGRVEGKVRLIYHPEEGNTLDEGEILVAPSTDPAWTPLFLKASGIVMETGGFLSHGSIVSREYGIPAVVNVAGVMKKLKNGDRIIVDGDEGKVYII